MINNDFVKLGFGSLLICLIGFMLSGISFLISRPPKFTELAVQLETVSGPIRVDDHSRAQRFCIQTPSGCHRIPFWTSDLPSQLSEIRHGDQVKLYSEGNDVWQLEDKGKIVISYETTRSFREDARAPSFIFPSCAGIVGVFLLITGMIKHRFILKS
jgi:hypothetical protein